MNPRHYRPNSSTPQFPFFPSYNSQYASSTNTPHFFNPPNFSRNSISHYVYDEQALRDEVIYLHSLWHQGPPSSAKSTSQNPTLKPLSTTPFKKKKKKKKKKMMMMMKKPIIVSNKEWPVNSDPSTPSTSGSAWPEFKRVFSSATRPASAGEVASIMAMRAQRKGLDACCEFFESDDGDDDDGNDDDNVDEEKEGGGDNVFEESEELAFFLKLFEGDEELRGCYEKYYQNGEFSCLVCAGIRQKLRKKYFNCHALVQHCITISKTKKRRAHRAYGQVICKVLGWDINRLPVWVPPAGDTAGQSLEQPSVMQTSLKGDDACKDLGGYPQRISESTAEATPNGETSLERDDAHTNLKVDHQGGSGSGTSAEVKKGKSEKICILDGDDTKKDLNIPQQEILNPGPGSGAEPQK
ncbi:hypothetical protein Ancab_025584 [Ancistrocladus abbreviatus]